MGQYFSSLRNHRIVGDAIAAIAEWLLLSLLFSGSFIFSYFESKYRQDFEKVCRNHRTVQRRDEDDKNEVPDWENPSVVGRKRRKMHTVLHSFRCKEDSIMFWCQSSPQNLTSKYSSRHLLTDGILKGQVSEMWNFCLVGRPADVPEGWHSSCNLTWSPMALPCHWQLKGFDVPIYTNTMYPFAFDPPRVRRNGVCKETDCDRGLGGVGMTGLHDKEPGENATGLFQRQFSIPADWQTSFEKYRVFLVFEGVDSCLSAWVNGHFVGYSQDSCLSAEFDVTDSLNWSAGQNNNDIAVQVSRWCDGSYLEDQDKWWLSGIYREVYLYRKPNTFICDYEITYDISLPPDPTAEKTEEELIAEKFRPNTASIDEFLVTASIDVVVQLEQGGTRVCAVQADGSERCRWAVRTEIWDNYDSESKRIVVATACAPACRGASPSLRDVAESITRTDEADVSPDCPREADRMGAALHLSVKSPRLWTAEDPHLYLLVVSLHPTLEDAQRDEHAVEVESCRLGLRQVKITTKDNVLCINGKPITIAGVNRHEFHPSRGRSVDEATMRQDITIMKQFNFNAVRCSHYPPHPRFLELCDEAGLYVIDEANIETHGFQTLGQPVDYLSHQPEWASALCSRVARMVERDKNYACIIGWSLGNESGVGPTHEAMAAWLRARDPRRIVHYESGGAASSCTDVICPMYQRIKWCTSQARRDSKRRPVILCEYAHAMGNSGGCLADYWSVFRNASLPRLQGGFIWDFVDQGLVLPDGKGFGYGGDFGDYPNTGPFCINGILGPDRVPHPIAFEAAALQAVVSFRLQLATPVELKKLTEADRPSESADSVPEPSATAAVAGGAASVGRKSSRSKRREMESQPEKLPTGTVIDGELKAKDEDALCLVIQNYRNHLHMEDIRITATLRCDIMEPHHEVSPVMLLPDAVPAGQASAMKVTDLWPALDLRGPGGIEALARSLDLSVDQLSCAKELWFIVVAETTAATPWVPAGHVIKKQSLSHWILNHTLRSFISANEELERRDVKSETEAPSMEGSCIRYEVCPVDEGDPVFSGPWGTFGNKETVQVFWKSGATATIGVTCGRILQWKDPRGRPNITSPIDVCLWRAPTNNDSGGDFLSYASRWKAVGLHCLRRCRNQKGWFESKSQPEPDAIEDCAVIEESGGLLYVEASWRLVPSEPVASPCAIAVSATYEFLPGGGIDISFQVSPPSSLPVLPRVGLRFCVPGSFKRAQWLGLGPHEAYCDRKSSVHLNTFESSIKNLHVPYVVPQESGSRADPRWVAFRTGVNGRGLLAVPNPEPVLARQPKSTDSDEDRFERDVTGWSWSASEYSLEGFESCRHDHELHSVADGRVHVHIDSAMMGVGGVDSWSPNVSPDRLIYPSSEGFLTTVSLFPLHEEQDVTQIYRDFNSGKFSTYLDSAADE